MVSRIEVQPPVCAVTISALGRRSCVMTISVLRPLALKSTVTSEPWLPAYGEFQVKTIRRGRVISW